MSNGATIFPTSFCFLSNLFLCILLTLPILPLVTESMALKQIEREEKYGDALTKKHDSDSKDKK